MIRRGSIDEFELIRRYFARRQVKTPGVRLGIGDDAAVLRMPPGRDLVVSTDCMVEGTHFPVGTPAHSLGYRALAVNLSDLAAMGARPLWATLVLSLPKAEPRWLQDFARGFFSLARRAPIALVGGDTVRGPLAITVTVHGAVARQAFVSRSGAAPDDAIYVTGFPGDAVGGRMLLGRGRSRALSSAARSYLVRRFHYPTPRLVQGAALVGVASAMIDVSDGLDEDVRKLLSAAKVGGLLDIAALPVSPALLRAFGVARAREFALTGGDDYELAFTVPPRNEARLRRIAARWPCPVTRIGVVAADRDRIWRLEGRLFSVPPKTFRHF
jgi:thiamine-monophosphate kinase